MPFGDQGVPPINIPLGQLVRWDGRLMTARGRARDRFRSHVFVDQDNVPVTMTDREFVDRQMVGRLRLVSQDELSREEKDLPPRTLDLASPEDLKEVERRLHYIRAWDRAGRPPRDEDGVGGILEDVAARRGETAPSARTFARWVANWMLVGEKPEGLLPGRGGNREDRLAAVRHLLRETIETHYLVDTRPTATAVHRRVEDAFEQYNAPLAPEERIPVPSLMAVLRQIREIDQYTLDFCREGPRVAAHRYRPVTSGPVAERHNEVWEMDHTRVDAIVVDENTGLPISRPWVTVIIDRATRAVMGFRIGFEPPSAYSALDCLRIAAMPKHELLATVSDIRGTWPVMGLPRVLMTDQGKEFKAKSFVEACLALGIDVEYAPILKAWYKGRIERFFRTLSRDVFHRVPGTTFSNFFALNGEVVPERVAVVTLPELRSYTLLYIADVYMRRPHRALAGRSPQQLWDQSVASHGIRPLPTLEQLFRLTSLTVWRKPQRYGLEFEGLVYNSGDVAGFRIRPGRPDVVRVRVDPHDLSRVWFTDPDSGEAKQVPIVPAMRPLVAGISLEKHRLARALQRQNPERLAGEAGLKRAHRILDVAMNLKANGDGLRNRAKAARYWEALTQSRPPEDAPAFDVGRSSKSLIEEVMDEHGSFADGPRGGMAPAPEADPRDDGDNGAGGDDESGDGAPADPHPAPKPVRPRGGAAATADRHLSSPVLWPGPTTPEDDGGEDDLDAIVRGLGLRMTGGVKEGE